MSENQKLTFTQKKIIVFVRQKKKIGEQVDVLSIVNYLQLKAEDILKDIRKLIEFHYLACVKTITGSFLVLVGNY